MSTWEVLNYIESAETSRRLEEIQQENQWHREAQARDRLDNALKYLLQELYRKNGNVSQINLSGVPKIERDMKQEYNHIFYSKRPKKSILGIIMVIGLLLSLLIANFFEPNPIIFGLLILGLMYGLYQMNAQKAMMQRYEENTEFQQRNVRIVQKQFPYLTSLGLYTKHYLDRKVNDVMTLLKQDNYQRALDAKEALYKLFDMKYYANIDYDLNVIHYWNNELMAAFDNAGKE